MARKKYQPKNKSSSTLRIIGGQWRSRKLQLIDAPGMRPTPDRIRETLFNWLQNDINGAKCLDLFAGSGALGLEALSRGASDVVFIEKNKTVASQLKANLQLLKSEIGIINEDALAYLSALPDLEQKSFDTIFLDPPYRKGLLESSLKLLNEKSLIHSHTLIYIEHEAEESLDWGIFGLEIIKQSNAGQVHSFLARSNDAHI